LRASAIPFSSINWVKAVKTLSKSARLALLLSSVLYFFSYPEVDPDLWGHLFFGKEILQRGTLPPHNLYSYTAPDHAWINHEWLAEVILYGVYHFFGSGGLILFKMALGGVLVFLLNLTLRRSVSSLWVRALALVWTMAILSPGFNIRPQIFTYVLFTGLLVLFYRREEKESKALFLAPFFMSLWVHLHGGFVAGVGAISLFLLWTVIGGLRRRNRRAALMTEVVIPLMLSGLVLVLNPYGLQLLTFVGGDVLVRRPITEWEPIPLLDFSFLEFKLGLIWVLLATPWKGSWRRWDFVLTLLAALLALGHQRHTPLFAIAAAPFLAMGLQRVFPFVQKRMSEWLLATAVGGMALYQISAIGGVHLQNRFQLIVSPREYPTQAAEFLTRNGVHGNLAVPFEWGEYLIWKLYPEVRVSVDGRYTTAYPFEVIEDNFEWMRGGENWRRLLDIYPTDIAVTNRYHPVTALLRKDPEWVYIYSDPIAFIFVRNVPAQAGFLQKFKEKRLLPPEPPSLYFPG